MDPLKNDDEESSHSSSYRRIWKHRSGAQGSSKLSLKAMAVLYDADAPLTRDELADRLLARVDAYERDYLEAWYLRRCAQKRRWKSGDENIAVDVLTEKSTSTMASLKTWLVEVFANRVRKGTSLIRDADGRFRPGPQPPRVLTMDGQLRRFTPEARKELEQADHDRGRTHLVSLEFDRILKVLAPPTADAHAQILIFLVNHLYVSDPLKITYPKVGVPISLLRKEFKHLLYIADSPAVKAAVLQLAVDSLKARAPEARHDTTSHVE